MSLAKSLHLDHYRLPHFVFVTEDLSEGDMVRVYRTANAFVLPTRGEGWGLPAMQAMSMALPTISTKFGGQVDFMTAWNSFLIPLDGVEELPEDTPYGYVPAKRWANAGTIQMPPPPLTFDSGVGWGRGLKWGNRADQYITIPLSFLKNEPPKNC